MVETVHSLYCSNSPHPLSDHTTNDTVSSQTIYQHADSHHAGFLYKAISQMTHTNTDVIQIIVYHTYPMIIVDRMQGESIF